MKKNFYFLLMAALVCGLSLSVTSCKDDDKNDSNGGDDSELVEGGLSEEDAQAWSWISVLTDEATQESGWQKKSYDVTIGLQSDNDPGARLIIVSDLDDAKANFSTIAGCAPEELNTTKTVSAGSYGSMTWNISEQGAPNIATVEVNSKLLKITQLIYCTEEQVPDKIDFFSVDVSFISLRLVLPAARKLMSDNAYAVCLIKPQFEAGRENVGKKGVVRNPEIHCEVVKGITEFCLDNGFDVCGLTYSPIKGPEGNIEYLIFLHKSENPELVCDVQIEDLVRNSHSELDRN